jgi:hypothetical protein
MATTLLRAAAVIGVGGSLVAVAVPAFIGNLSASKWSEPVSALSRVARGALAHAATHPHDTAFPPSAPATPEQVPRGETVLVPAEAWSHLSWRALDFSMEASQAYSYRFDSALDPATGVFRFAATAQGDLDGDGNPSTFQIQGEKRPDGVAHLQPGMLVHREVE